MVELASAPLLLDLEFVRVEQAVDPYAFRFAPQEYLLRSAGGGVESARFPWDEPLLADLAAVRLPGRDPAIVARLGETLRCFLMPLGWAELSAQIVEASRQGRRVHLTFRSAAAELYALPWEFLTLRATGQHLGELPQVILRYEWPQTSSVPEQPAPRKGCGRILLAWSAAAGMVPAAEHAQAIDEACRAGFLPFDPARDVLAHASLGRLTAALAAAKKEQQPIAVLHLLAHGGASGSTFGLVLSGESPGEQTMVVDAGRLRQLLAPYADMVRLVVLMACDSGNAGALGNQLGSVAQTLHRAGIAAVVASRFPLSVSGSVTLSQSLYSGLLSGPNSLESSLLAGRTALAQDATSLDWASLQLYARAADGDDSRPILFRPYQGLASFQREHSRFFFGRRALTEKLWQRCRELFAPSSPTRLLAVLGPSGSGKSSVVRAGLLTELAERPLPDLQPLRVAVVRPGGHPTEELQRTLAELPAVSPEPPLLVVVDQFEEAYTLCSDAQERDAFVAGLLQMASDRTRRVAVVLTLRSDFFGETQRHHGALNQLIAAQHELVPGLTEDEHRQTITEPARVAGRPLDPDTVELLLHEARGNESALPLLEFALTRIWEGVLAGKEPGATLREIGGVGGALADQAKKLYAALDASEQRTARRALMRLVKLGEGTRDTRRRALLSELCGRGETPDDVLSVLRKFATQSARIVTLAGSGADTVAEVTHETLFDHWAELHTWIDEGRADRRFHDRVAEAARLWSEDRSRSGRLWRPPDLDLLREFRERKPEELAALDEEFFGAAEKAFQAELTDKKRSVRRLRMSLILVSGLLVIAVVVVVVALIARDRATQRELDMVVENSRQLLVEKDRPVEALQRLLAAKERGARSKLIPDLLANAARSLDAVQLVLFSQEGNYSPDGERIVAVHAKTARVFDARTGQLLTTLQGHTDAVDSASYSPDGNRIVTASWDKTARVFDAQSGQLLLTLQGHSAGLYTANYSLDGNRIVTDGADKTVRVWDAQTGRLLTSLPGSGGRSVLSFSPDGQYIIASGSEDEPARVFEVKTGQLFTALRWDSGVLLSASYSPDGRRIVTTSADRAVRIFDAKTGQLLLTVMLGAQAYIPRASYSPDGRRVVVASQDKTARVFDAQSGQLLATLQGHSAAVESASYSPDGRRIVTASFDKTARVFDAQSGQLLAILQGHLAWVQTASYSPDGQHIITTSADLTTRVWDAEVGQRIAALPIGGLAMAGASYSPDGQRIVTIGNSRTARVFDVKTGQLLTTLRGHTAIIQSASYSPNGQRIVTTSADKTARVWDLKTGQLLATLQGHSADVRSARYSPDGQRILTASEDTTVRVWDATSGQLLTTLLKAPNRVLHASYSPDGRRIVIVVFGAGCTVEVRDAMTGKRLTTLFVHELVVASASYSPDGRRIVTAGSESTQVWDAQSGQLLATLRGHSAVIRSASYSPDGLRIITGSDDATARVWDAQSGQLLATLRGHSAGVQSARYSPDGLRVVTASSDGVWIWDVAPETRTSAQLTDLIRCRSTERLAGDSLVDEVIDSKACQNLPSRAPRPLLWSERNAPLWGGIYALQAGRMVHARAAFLEARRRLEHFQDLEGLAKLTLAEAALSASDSTPAPVTWVELLGKIDPKEQPKVRLALAELAHDRLYRPAWALAISGELQKGLPTDPARLAEVRANELKYRLSAGLAAEVLGQAPEVLAAQTTEPHKAALAALAFVAALQEQLAKDQQLWATRTLDLYTALKAGTKPPWNFDGSRHAFLQQKESAARTAALELFEILEQEKSPATTEKLTKLLAAAPPAANTK